MDERYFIKYLFVGDSSRYDFVSGICGRKVEPGTDVELFYGKDYVRNDVNGKIHIASPAICPGFRFFLPADFVFDLDADERWIEESYAEVFVFNEHPYGKKDVMELFEYDAIKPYNTTLILYKKKRKFGYGDLDTEEDAIRMTEKNCKNKCKNIVVYDEDVSDKKPLLTDYDYINRISYEFRRTFIRNYESFKENFSFYYNIFISRKTDEIHTGIFEYSKAKTYQGNIGDYFVDSYARDVFTEAFGQQILELCKFYLSEIFEEEYISQLADRMYGQVKNSYEKHFEKIFWSKVGTIKMPDSEIDYMKMMNEKNIVSVFTSQVNSFFIGEQKTCQEIMQKEFYEIDLLLKKADRTMN